MLKLQKDVLAKLILLREELRYLGEVYGFPGDTELTMANTDWNSTAAALRPHVILHTDNLSRGSVSGHKKGTWFTVVSIPKSFPLTVQVLDDLIGKQQGSNSAVDALTTLAQEASTLPDHQRAAVTKALSTVRKTLKL